MTDTTLVLTMEYQILLSSLSTSWLVPTPVLGLIVVGGIGVVPLPGVALDDTGVVPAPDVVPDVTGVFGRGRAHPLFVSNLKVYNEKKELVNSSYLVEPPANSWTISK